MTGADRIEAAFSGQVGRFHLDTVFDAPMRGVTALFGPSGSGKTTVLRCIAGLERVAGRLSVGGSLWQDAASGTFRRPHTRPVGYVFQEASLFGHLSVRRNLLYGAKRGGDRPGLEFEEAIALLGIEALLDRAPQHLSGGERQRVALGRALLSRPRLLLMDEPLTALDRAAKDDLLPYFERLHQRLDIPVLYVSHDISEVVRLADRIVLLSKGRMVAQGAVPDMLARLDLGPATGRFEAGVVLSARVAAHEPDFHLTRLDLNGQDLTVPAADIPVGGMVRLRIRARDVALARERPPATSIRNVLAGTLAEIREEPDSAFAETLIAIDDARLRARITRKSAVELGLKVGLPVYALIKSVAFDGRAVGGGDVRDRS